MKVTKVEVGRCTKGKKGWEIMTLEEKKLLEEMKKIRFLKNGLEDIELYETLNIKLREYTNIECIPYLCEIMEDDAENCSAVEGVLETILLFVKQNEVESAINAIIESSLNMKGHGDSWLRILHTQLLRDEEIREVYIKCIKNANKQEKELIIDVFEVLKAKRRVKNVDMDEVINRIK